MDDVLTKVCAWLDGKGIAYRSGDEDYPEVIIGAIRRGAWGMPLVVVASRTSNIVTLSVVLSPKIPRATWPAIWEFIGRVNDRHVRALLTLNLGDQLIGAQTCLVLNGADPLDGQLEELVDSASYLLARTAPGILGVAFGGMTPAEACALTGYEFS